MGKTGGVLPRLAAFKAGLMTFGWTCGSGQDWWRLVRTGLVWEGWLRLGRSNGVCAGLVVFVHGWLCFGRTGLVWAGTGLVFQSWCRLAGLVSFGRAGVVWQGWCRLRRTGDDSKEASGQDRGRFSRTNFVWSVLMIF
jgi:hypothetical protein